MMKRIFILLLIASAFLSCKKNNPDDVKFKVTSDKLTVTTGTPISFYIENAPESLTFFSGEKGYEYKFRNRDTLSGKIELQFSTYVINGLGKNLRVFIASDLPYPLDANSINNVNWTEITDKTVISTGTDNTPSGIVNLSEYNNIGSGKIAIAFKYADVKRTNSQSTVYVRDLKLNKTNPDGTVIKLMDLTNGQFQSVDVKNSSAVWSINTTRLYLTGGNASSEANEDWVVSKLIDLKRVSGDVGIVKKSITQTLDNFTYTYNSPGTYTATVVGINNYAGESKEQTQAFTIVVTK